MVWYGMVWYGMVRCGVLWSGVVWAAWDHWDGKQCKAWYGVACFCKMYYTAVNYLEFFPPFTNEHIPVIVTPVHIARFRTFRLRNSLMALKVDGKLCR